MCNSHCMAQLAESPHRSLAPHRGDWMRKALEFRGLTSKEMAEYLDVTPSTISRWLNNHQPAPRSIVRLWALRAGVPISYLETGVIPDNFDPDAPPPVNDLKQTTLAPVTGIFDRKALAS